MLRASRTSAEPERELTDRLPHLTTRQPPAATMREAPVEMLMVLAPSPPVPAVSRTPAPVIGKGLAALRKARAAPVMSAAVSPRALRVARRAAMWMSE